MRIVYLNFFYSKTYHKPENWLTKMQPVNIVLEELAKRHTVVSVQQINYECKIINRSVYYRFVKFCNQPTFLPFRLNLLVKTLRPDVIIVHGTVFPLQTILLRILVGKNVKIVVQHHSEQPYNGIKKWVQKLASTFVNAYFFPSKIIGDNWQKNGNITANKPIFKIHEGASIFKQVDKEIARLLTKTKGEPIYIWVGRLDAKKQPLLAMEAFNKFLKICSKAKLYILYYKSTLEKEVATYLVENQFLNNSIILVGSVKYEDMLNWYSSADFYISSSLHEGTSFTLSEAMSCGCVPIVSNIPTHAEMLGSNCGLIYDVNDKDGLLEALTASISMRIEEERKKVLHQYRKHLSPSSIANNIETSLAQIL